MDRIITSYFINQSRDNVVSPIRLSYHDLNAILDVMQLFKAKSTLKATSRLARALK